MRLASFTRGMTASNPILVYLARHGQSEWNNQSLITGQLDPGLSAKGRQQAQALAQCLAGEPLSAIYASSLQRTLATAQPTAVAQSLPVTRLAALDEIHLGVLQGRHRDERDPEAQAIWARWVAEPWRYRVPGGERFDEFAGRVEQAWRDILLRHAGQRILIVGHRATNRVLLGLMLGWPRARWHELRLRNKYAYRLELGEPATIATLALSGSKTGTCVDGFIM